MSESNYSTTIAVDRTAHEAFAAVTDVRGWWAGQIEGETDRLGAEFTYTVPGTHWTKLRITSLVPAKEVVWRVLDSDIAYTRARTEWNDTEIRFEFAEADGRTQIRFTHVGLLPEHECYESCSQGWGMFVDHSLRQWIITGEVQPSPFGAA